MVAKCSPHIAEAREKSLLAFRRGSAVSKSAFTAFASLAGTPSRTHALSIAGPRLPAPPRRAFLPSGWP
jgi:hypothetical protein